MLNAAHQVGTAMGIASLGGLVSGPAFMPGFRVAVVVAAVACLAGAPITLATVGLRRSSIK